MTAPVGEKEPQGDEEDDIHDHLQAYVGDEGGEQPVALGVLNDVCQRLERDELPMIHISVRLAVITGKVGEGK